MEHYRKLGNFFKEKKSYKTQDEAIADAKIINKNLKQIHKVVPYRCSICISFRYHTVDLYK